MPTLPNPEIVTWRYSIELEMASAIAFRELCHLEGAAKVYLWPGRSPDLFTVEVLTAWMDRLRWTIRRFNKRGGVQIALEER